MKNNTLITTLLLFCSSVVLTGCGSSEDGKGTMITDCNIAAHQEVDGTAKDGANKEFTLGEITNSCLKEKGLKPASDKSGCFIEPKAEGQGKPYVRAAQECWDK